VDERQSLSLRRAPSDRGRDPVGREPGLMRPFEYRRAATLAEAAALGTDPDTAILAGGTELVAWLDAGIVAPGRLVDISRVAASAIDLEGDQLRIGALARVGDVAADPRVRAEAPALAAAIAAAASPAIRAMGTLAGNLLQRTRCPYFRSGGPCNQRIPGSGCPARDGDHRAGAIFGLSAECVAVHPSDPAVALVHLDASVVLVSAAGSRSAPVRSLYPELAGGPSGLADGELIAEIVVPVGPVSRAARYRKVRDRAAFDFALVSVAASCQVEAGTIRAARLTLGSVGPGPRRCRAAEAALIGAPMDRASVERAVDAELALAEPLPGNRFKVELVRRVAVDLILGTEAGS
jgi:xanthine dehydrogenase YagS FAD-binding subunit